MVLEKEFSTLRIAHPVPVPPQREVGAGKDMGGYWGNRLVNQAKWFFRYSIYVAEAE